MHRVRAERGGRDVVLALGFITWADGEPERGVASAIVARHLTRALLDDERVGRVLVANPFRSLAGRLRGRGRDDRDGFPVRDDAALFQPLRLRRADPLDLDRAERAYRAYDRRLAAAARRAGLGRPVVITTSPLLAGLAPLDWTAGVTYYARDDYSEARAFGQVPYRALFRDGYRGIRTRARSVAAVSSPLLKRIDTAGRAAVVPNGIDPEQWRAMPEPNAELSALPGPRLLYHGGLDRRLDAEQLLLTADRYAAGSIVLVGPQLEPEHAKPLLGRPNVHLWPPCGRSELPSLLAAADVGILPYQDDRGTLAMSPLKLYEYLAAGLPVAATDLPAMRGTSDRVILASRGDAFAEAVQRALSLGRAGERERMDFIDANSWRQRHMALIDFALGDADGSADRNVMAHDVAAVLATGHADDREAHGVPQVEGRSTLTH